MTTPATPPPPAPVPLMFDGIQIWREADDLVILHLPVIGIEDIRLSDAAVERMLADLTKVVATRAPLPAEPSLKPPEIMFAVYCREPGSDNWFEQETNTDESLCREWRDRNNERSPELYDPTREYILVRKTTTFTKLP